MDRQGGRVMAIDTTPLDRVGIHVSPRELEQLILAATQGVLPSQRLPDAHLTLPPDEAAALERGGMCLDDTALGAADPLVRSAAEYAALLAASYTVSEAAAKLRVDPSRIRHRLADRTIYGIRLSTGWRVPAFQFVDDAVIPGLPQVLPRLAADLHPLSVLHWLTLPNSDLVVGPDEQPVSPLEWLRLGLDSRVVADLAETIGSGV
jgi:hypothetical protein